MPYLILVNQTSKKSIFISKSEENKLQKLIDLKKLPENFSVRDNKIKASTIFGFSSLPWPSQRSWDAFAADVRTQPWYLRGRSDQSK